MKFRNESVKRMTRLIQSLDLFVVSCFFLMVESQQGKILPPQHVSVLWVSDFQPQLSWVPPMENCTYEVVSKTMDELNDRTYRKINNSSKLLFVVMDGGFLQLSVKTVCNGIKSEPVFKNITYPDLVKDFKCYIHAAKQTRCSWLPNSHAPDLRFFYRLLREDFTVSLSNLPSSYHIQECSSYHYTNGVRTGCDVEAGINHSIQVLFNGTLNNTLVRNTFKKEPFKNVRPPPLNWTVNKTGDKFNISWTPPDIDVKWTYTIKYTECDETKVQQVKDETMKSILLTLVPHCPYNLTIKAETSGVPGGETPWSDWEYFDADADTGPYVFVYAAIIIPLMFAVLAVVILVCCRKNKESIFPKVPVPRDLLSDISENNNKSNMHNLYVPAEEEDCKITLVVDHQINKLAF